MSSYSLSHLADCTLLHNLTTLVAQDRATTAALLAHLGEVDERRLYVPAAYDSMYAYCVGELHMSEDVAYKRIAVARAARRFPAIYSALAAGSLHLSAVVMLAPHLAPDTADELLAAATHKTKNELERLLADRFPKPDVPTLVQAIVPANATRRAAAGREDAPDTELAPGRVDQSIAAELEMTMGPLPSHPKLAPLSQERYEWHLTVDKETHEQLRYAQALLSHAVPSGDVPEVLKRALSALVRDLEKQKFAKGVRSRAQRCVAKGRHIPSVVKGTVWQRDGGQCTFVSENGKRCQSRTRLEFDHVLPVARGGQATVAGIRLRCRAHNQFAAECAFGREFMRGKRAHGRERTLKAEAEAKAQAQASGQEQIRAEAEAASQEEVVPWLRALGCNVETARRAAARCAGMVGAPLEKRVRAAVQSLGPPSARRVSPELGVHA